MSEKNKSKAMMTFTKKDLVNFGLYLLSEERENNLKQTNEENTSPYEERKRKVHDADIFNWLQKEDRN